MAPQPDGGHAADTNWSARTVGQMWNMVKDHNETLGWDQALAWMRTFELLDYHRLRIQAYRDLLVAKWPPERSPAAAAFLTQVDALLASLTQMRDAAMANGPALEQITAGISEARIKLASVHRDWAASQAKLDSYNQQVTMTKSGTPAPAPSPPPVPPGQQAALHAQAVTIMSVLGSQALESEAAMKRPPSYQPPTTEEAPLTHLGSPSQRRADASRTSGGASLHPISSMAHDSTQSDGSMPSLTGAPVMYPPSNAGTAEGHPAKPFIPAQSIPADRTVVPIPVVQGAGADKGSTGRTTGFSTRRSLSPGHIIRSSSPAAENERQLLAPGAPKVNAVGGLIGPATGEETAGVTNTAVGAGRATGHQRGKRQRAYDLDEQWCAHKGVPPVLMPPAEPGYHDPGPILGPQQ
jgi:hypothetical protein